jgi:TAG lipase / steryl ester hydrolase / phospholipase A2 / LPA acyltransferase
MLSKLKAWVYTNWKEDLTQEIIEISEVYSEIADKIYSKAMEYLYDMGEIMIQSRKMDHAKDWNSWKKAALEVDKLQGKDEWKQREQSTLYDYKLLRRRLILIKDMRKNNDVQGLVHHLRSGLFRGLGGNLHPELYNKCLVGTKKLIIDYQIEVKKGLLHVLNSETFLIKDKITFFTESRYAYGRTALLLSGGGGLGMYHLGVIKALYEQGLLPKIIAGTSAGSIVACFVGTTLWEKIPSWFEPGGIKYGPFTGMDKGSWARKITRLVKEGHLMDISKLQAFLIDNIGEITFEEAYKKTGFILNITVSEYSEYNDYRLMNYLTAPHVLIWSAVLASCAIPYVFQPVELKCKNYRGETVAYHPSGLKFIDGSVKADLPMQRLAELFNVNAFIVSQTNPWVIPLLSPDDGGGYWGDSFQFKALRMVKKLCLMELRHRVKQLNLMGLCNFVTWILGILTQEYRGHVTIWPIPSIRDYINILSNPSEEDIQRCVRKGLIRTFPKFNLLKSIMAIENELENCCSSLKQTIKTHLKPQDLEEYLINDSNLSPGFSLTSDNSN